MGRLVSDYVQEADGARASQAAGENGLGPGGTRRARGEVTGRGEEMGCRAKSEEKEIFLFLFPFQLFQSIFK
jgi:hypothetical protein